MQIWKYACLHCMHVCVYECFKNIKVFKFSNMQLYLYDSIEEHIYMEVLIQESSEQTT